MDSPALEAVDVDDEGDISGGAEATSGSKLTAVERLSKETSTPFGFDPALMMILICLPLVLNYFRITPWLYIPAAVLFFGYLQSKKDRIDRKIAMGIVSDPTLLKLILEEMPSWPTDSGFQQMVRYCFCISQLSLPMRVFAVFTQFVVAVGS